MHVQEVEKEILEMRTAEKTNREIAKHFGVKDKYVVKWWVSRYHQRERGMEAGIQPRRRGRPPKGSVPTEQEKDNEIRRLKMENGFITDSMFHFTSLLICRFKIHAHRKKAF